MRNRVAFSNGLDGREVPELTIRVHVPRAAQSVRVELGRGGRAVLAAPGQEVFDQFGSAASYPHDRNGEQPLEHVDEERIPHDEQAPPEAAEFLLRRTDARAGGRQEAEGIVAPDSQPDLREVTTGRALERAGASGK